MLKFLSENLKIILVGLISILMIIAGAIILALYFGGDVARQLVIAEINGTAYITRDGKRMNASKRSVLKSGDTVTTAENSSVRITADGDKAIWVEPNSSLYIYYTDVASKGDISVNLTGGSAICQLNKAIRNKASFTLKTPNSSISVKDAVFRTKFSVEEEYMGHSNVMITEIQNFCGDASLQLYDMEKEPSELPMLLIKRTSAQLVTGETICKYGYLNYSFDLLSLSDLTLGSLIKASSDRELAFSPEEVNRAYKVVREDRLRREREAAAAVTSVSIDGTTVTTVTSTEKTTETTTAPPETETSETTSYGTLSTTMQTHEYTTYSGIKWWEMTGNTNTGTDDYDDWFDPDKDSEYTDETTVPAGGY